MTRKYLHFGFAMMLLFFNIGLIAAQSKQGYPFSNEELSKITSINQQKANVKSLQVTASNKTFNLDSIQYWVGKGSKRAAMGVQWKNSDGVYDPVMVWGYRWEDDVDGTGERMIRAIAAHDSRLYLLLMGGTAYGTAIGGIGYDRNFNGDLGIQKGNITLTPENGVMASQGSYNFDGWTAIDADDYWFSGWMDGFLTYMVRADYTTAFNSSGVGATSRKLTDGNWDIWVANSDFSWISDETIQSKFIAATPTPNYSEGTFFVNEDWFGHNNSTVNFLTDDGDWTYRAYQKENPGHELGATSPFGTIYGGKMYIVSKQAKDPGATITGSRLAVANARTMKTKAEFETIGNADGRSFLGVNDTVGYIGTSAGIYLFDIKNLALGTLITNTSNEAGLYDGQIGTMLRIENRVFAVLQNTGILVINAHTNTLETIIEGSYGSIVMSKDGNIWASTDEGANAGKTLIKINPYTLEKENFMLPAEAAIPNSWYAWTADGFCASKQSNAIYWKNNGGWSSSTKIYRLDTNSPTSEPEVIFDSSHSDWGIYGAGFRIHPVTDEIYVSMYKDFGSRDYQVIKLSPNGDILAEYPMEPNYWFPAMPVFTDNYSPVIDKSLAKISFKGDTAIYLRDKITDADNFDAAIIKSFTLDNEAVVNAQISGDSLKLTSKGLLGSCNLTLTANSNGKLVSTDIEINVIDIPQINSQPVSQTIVVDEKVVFLVEASGGDLTYQWYRDDTAINRATSASYSISKIKLTDNGSQFYCVVTNSLGEVISDKVNLTTELIVPEITKQPISLTQAEKTRISFSITARGGDLKYQWYKDDTIISGATSTTYSIAVASALKDKNGAYHCVITNSEGSVTSDKATLILLAKAVITQQPADLSVPIRSSAVFEITTTGDDLKYQWYKDNVAIEGAVDSIYHIPAATANDEGVYHCVVQNEISTVTSTKATLTVSPLTGIHTEDSIQISVYPNPFSDYIIINSDKSQTVKLVNISGQFIMNIRVNQGENHINTGNLPQGNYFLLYGNKVVKIVK